MKNVQQPQIDAAHQLLHTGYEYFGLFLDLFGERDADGYDVQAVALVGQRIDLSELIRGKQLKRMGAWCDQHLPSAHSLLLLSQQEAQADRMQWQKMERTA